MCFAKCISIISIVKDSVSIMAEIGWVGDIAKLLDVRRGCDRLTSMTTISAASC